MEDIAQGAIVKNHDLTQVRLNLSKILDVSPVANSAMLAVVSPSEILALHLQPVDNRIGVLLNRSGEYDQVVPFTDLSALSVRRREHQAGRHTFFKKSSQYGRLWT
jgi:hypothetical protein